MRFFRRCEGSPRRLGILSGSFHPPTIAHLALARAALSVVDEVLFVLPRRFPHKSYRKVSFEDRIRMLEQALAGEPRFSIAATEEGLFIDIARECRPHYPPGTELLFLCGRDAAERIVNWDYGAPQAFQEMLLEFSLLVADRGGVYEPPVDIQDRVKRLTVGADYDEVSSTGVRERIARGEPWRELVPEGIAGLVSRLYS